MPEVGVTHELAKMAAALAATSGNRDGAIAKLVAEGGDESRTALGVDLLPIAFGWAAMAKMGVRPNKIAFAPNASAFNTSEPRRTPPSSNNST